MHGRWGCTLRWAPYQLLQRWRQRRGGGATLLLTSHYLPVFAAWNPKGWAALPVACCAAQMMIGLCGAELVRPDSVGASQGFLGWVAYLGAANAGIPLSYIVKNYGWGEPASGLSLPADLLGLCLLPAAALGPCPAVGRGLAAAIPEPLSCPHSAMPSMHHRCLSLSSGPSLRLLLAALHLPTPRRLLTRPRPRPRSGHAGAYFSTLLAACGCAVVLLAPMINAKSYVQIQDEAKAKEA
jgi:hypothetical protein